MNKAPNFDAMASVLQGNINNVFPANHKKVWYSSVCELCQTPYGLLQSEHQPIVKGQCGPCEEVAKAGGVILRSPDGRLARMKPRPDGTQKIKPELVGTVVKVTNQQMDGLLKRPG